MFHKETLEQQEKRHQKEREKLLADIEKERKKEVSEKKDKKENKKEKDDPWARPEKGHW